MKKFLLILLFSILFFAFPINLSGQTKNQPYQKQQETYKTVVYVDWQLSNEACYGCSSFYWRVTRSYEADAYGYYIFDFWFYSNSLYENGAWASTYVYDMYIQVDGYWLNSQPFWITFKDYYSPVMMRFKTVNPKPFINLIWGGQRVL